MTFLARSHQQDSGQKIRICGHRHLSLLSTGPEEPSKVCAQLLHRIDKRENIGFTSSLVLDEVMYKILLKTIEGKHRRNPLDVIQKSVKEIGAQSSEIRNALDIILGIEGLNVVPVDRSHIESTVDYLEKFSVLPRDAVHFSVMKSLDCVDIASSDGDFDRVEGINRWTPLAPK